MSERALVCTINFDPFMEMSDNCSKPYMIHTGSQHSGLTTLKNKRSTELNKGLKGQEKQWHKGDRSFVHAE